MIRWLRRLILVAVAAYLAVLAAIAIFIELYDPPDNLPRNAAIVVLAAGQQPDGTVGPSSRLRTEAGLALYLAGTGTRLILTGGDLRGAERPVAAAMADLARNAGVPATAILVEGKALSTLQNALFTADLLGPAAKGPVILVTQRFHLPRAWLSFQWAGLHDLTLYPADTAAEHWQGTGVVPVLLEGVKTPLNALRALGASVADFAGIPEARYMPLLE